MDDKSIVDLYWKRSEQAIAETHRKYGGYCFCIAHNVLANNEDAQECVNDTYLATWNALPPHRPAILTAFLGKLTRRISIDRWRSLTAYKRGGGQVAVALEELGECASSAPSAEAAVISREMGEAFNRYLDTLPREERLIFLRRYFFFDPVAKIAKEFGFTESKVTSILHRTRKKLRQQLSKEGYL